MTSESGKPSLRVTITCILPEEVSLSLIFWKLRGRPMATVTVATPRRMAIKVSALRSGRAKASPTPSTIGCGSRTRLARPRNQRPLAPRGAMALVKTTTGLSKPARSAGSVAASPTSTRAHPSASSPTPTEKLGSYVKPSA